MLETYHIITYHEIVYISKGEREPKGTLRPHQTPSVWTSDIFKHIASTQDTPGVDEGGAHQHQ